jgi:hypothetical protein
MLPPQPSFVGVPFQRGQRKHGRRTGQRDRGRRDEQRVAGPAARTDCGAAIAGTTIGWYDFFLFLGALPLVFFPRSTAADDVPALVLVGAGFIGRLAGGDSSAISATGWVAGRP